MSHAEKYFCIHKAQAADAGDTTFRIEILEDGFGGSATQVNGLGEVFRLHYEKTDTRNPLESPIQKGRMEFIMAVEDSSDLAIVNEFVGADETQYQMRLKKDGSVIWTGYILSDLLSYSEDDYPIPATIVAKDLSRLSAGTYPLEDERETIITTIADILDDLGFGLSIYTYTSWTEQNLDGSVAGDYDFLNRIYNETFALREYASSGDEADQPITNQEALQSILVNYGLILRQVDNAWRLYQLSALGDPTSVLQFEYNSSGVQQSSSTVNIDSDIDRTNRYVLPSSVSNVNPGLKRVRSTFNHRSRVAELTLPRNVYITGAGQESYSQSFISTGEQEIKLSGTLRAYHSTQESSGYADLLVRVGQYYFDGNNWTTTTTDRVRIDITGFPVQREDDDGNYFYYQGFFDISTPKVPGDATTPIEIEFENAVIEAGPDVVADETAYENIDFNIIKPGDDEANSAALVYQLRQSGSYSTNVDLGETLFGDGPSVSSKSALRYSTATNDITSTSWQRRGTTSGYRLMHENLFKELIDLQRTNTRNMNAEVYGNYSPANMISYDSENFFFLGGYLSGRNYWQASFLRINIQTASDIFETIIKSTSGGVQGSSSTSSGGGSGGIDQSTADARYFKQASLLSEVDAGDLPTLYGNIGLDDGSADLDLNSLDINGSTFVDSSRNVSAREGNFSQDVTIDRGDFSRFNLIDTADREWHFMITSSAFVVQLNSGSFLFEVLDSGDVRIDEGGLTIGDTLTINSQLLFTPGNEQLLSTDAAPTFAGLTLPDLDIENGFGSALINIQRANSTTSGRIGGFRFLDFNGDYVGEIAFGADGDTDAGRFGVYTTPTGDTNRNLRFEVDSQGDAIFYNDVEGDGFTSGWNGSDWQITSAGDAEVQSLRVRGSLRVYEFIAKQLSSIGGTEILSIANGRIESVNAGSNEITVDNVDGSANTSFKADDLWIVQVVDVNNDLESGGTGSIVKQVRGSVTSVSGATLTVSVDAGSTDGLADLEQGDLIVAYGSSSDADRQAIMYRNVDRSEDNLIMRLQTGVDAFADLTAEANTAVAYGDLNGYLGISSEEFGFFAGDASGNYILATENQVKAVLDDINLDVVGGGSSGYGNADFFLDAGNHQLSLGDVFQADGGASTGLLAGINFDNAKLYTGDGTNGYVGLGATSGATDRAFWAGADNTDGSGTAGMYIQQNGTMVIATDAKITNSSDEFRIDSDGITFEEGTLGSQRLQWKESTFSTVRSEIYHNNHMIVDTENQFELRIDSTEEYNFDNNRLDLNVGTNKVLKLPHLSDAERDAFSAEEGDFIYNTDANGLQFYDGTNWVGS